MRIAPIGGMAVTASLLLAACSHAPTAVTDETVAASAAAGALTLKNHSSVSINYSAAAREALAFSNWAPCAGPACPAVPPGGSVRLPYSAIAFYAETTTEVVVYWWHSVADGGGGYRPDSIRSLIVPIPRAWLQDELTDSLPALWTWVPDSLSTVVLEGWSGLSASSRFVVRDPATWAEAWGQIYRYRTPRPPLPAVDFGAYSVLVAAMGTRPTGGFGIRIDSLAGTEAGAVSHLTETSPAVGCAVTAAVTGPVHAILVPAPVQVREWRVRQVVASCD